jgi:hypothetical protein
MSVESLRRVCAGNLHDWQGLSGCTLTELSDAFPRDSDWSGRAQLGRNYKETNYLWAIMPGTDERLRVWFESDRVILVDMECSGFPDIDPARLVGQFAEVPTALDTWLGTLPMPESELVFPRHGLAAFVNRETQSIWHLALFAPQSLGDYVDNLRIDTRVRRHQAGHPTS